MEDYLEAIVVLKEQGTVARVRDIGKHMNVKTSSVTAALNTLSRAGLVHHERYGYVDLTPRGEKIAQDIHRRHNLLIKFLTEVLLIEPEVAVMDACKIEHEMSAQTVKRLAGFIDFVEHSSEKGNIGWLNTFHEILQK